MNAAPNLELLDRAECLRLLGSVPIGRVAFTADALPAIQPVNFVVYDDRILFRTGHGSKLDAAVHNAVVAFQTDQYDPVRHTGWSVTAVGPATVITNEHQLARFALLPLRPWALGDRAHVIAVSIVILNGRRIVPLDGALGT